MKKRVTGECAGPLSGRTVVLGVTGCIAAYKACELARALMRAGAAVKVVMTDAATRFVTPLTFRTLTRQPVASSLWDEVDATVHHVSLAQEADVLVIAPCTANVLAKLAQGRADDLLTTTALATSAPVVVAPAMNEGMWLTEITQSNLRALRARGLTVVEPATGELACGESGEGRLAPIEAIAAAVTEDGRRLRDLEGLKLLVSAGGTREPLDAVRFIGNRSSGKTGYAVAIEATRRGATVALVTGPSEVPVPVVTDVVRVETAEQMRSALRERFTDVDALIMTAAVSDFRPREHHRSKIKKDKLPETIPLVRNPDILSELAEEKGDKLIVGFAAETDDVVGNARKKLVAKSLDLVVANDVSDPALGFASEMNRVWLVDDTGTQELPLMTKREIARVLLDVVRERLAERRAVK